jgi:hypothetical protein
VLDNSGFVVAVAYQQNVFSVWSKPFHRGEHDIVKVSVGVVFGTNQGLVSTTVIFTPDANLRPHYEVVLILCFVTRW